MKIRQVEFVKGATQMRQMPTDGVPEVAFVGRSNVGKSSLLNMLTGRKNIARTSRTPGKTQEFNFYRVNGRLYFVDLPGYGYARISKTQRAQWGRLIGQYLTEREPLRVVFHLVDSRHPPTALDQDVMATMRGSPVPYVIVLTKADKLSGNARARTKTVLDKMLAAAAMEVPVIFTSAKTGRGRDEVLRWIGDLAI